MFQNINIPTFCCIFIMLQLINCEKILYWTKKNVYKQHNKR